MDIVRNDWVAEAVRYRRVRRGPWGRIRIQAYGFFTDETLVRRARERHFPAFDALVERYRDRLYTMALRSLRNERQAGDALCAMFVSAYRDVHSSRALEAPRAWLSTHAFRAVFDRLDVPPERYKLRVIPSQA